MCKPRVTKTVLLFLLMVACILLAVVWFFPPADYIDNEWLELTLERSGWLGFAGFFLGSVLLTAVGLPRQLVAFSAGYIWGVFTGVLIATFAALAGCALTFYVSRQLLSPLLVPRFQSMVDVIDAFVERDALIKIIILRLQPLGTNLITNLSAGISKISARIFFPGTFVGYLPQMVVFGLTGSGVRVGSNSQLIISGVLFLFSLLLGAYLYRKGTLLR